MNPLMTGIQTIATTLASDDSSICSISIDNAVVAMPSGCSNNTDNTVTINAVSIMTALPTDAWLRQQHQR